MLFGLSWIFSRARSTCGPIGRRRSHRESAGPVLLEQLEERLLLALTSNALGGALTVFSTGADPIAIACVAGAVTINGLNPDSGPTSCEAISLILVKGGPGDNTIDLSGVNEDFPGVSSVTIEGLGGSDTIVGSQFADRILGALGNDTIHGGEGGDTVLGGEGNDSLDGGDGEDLIEAADDVNFTLTDSSLVGQGTDGHSTDSLVSLEFAHLIGGRSDNTLDASAFSGPTILDGGAGNDVLRGGLADDLLLGGAGNDFADGGEGNELLDGESGDDTLRGSAGADTLLGGSGHDLADGGAGDDDLDGESGNDTLLGFAGFDILLGGLGNDSLDAGIDDDFLDGGKGNNTLLGGFGDDTIDSGSGNDAAGSAIQLRFRGDRGPILDLGGLATRFDAEVEIANFDDLADLNVRIAIVHPAVQDLRVRLIPPEAGLGTILLVNTASASGADMGVGPIPQDDPGAVFDQNALISIANGTAPYIGSFIPEGNLDVLNGLGASQISGTWTLEITDSVIGNFGELLDWDLIFSFGADVTGGASGAGEGARVGSGNDSIDGGPGIDLIDYTLATRRVHLDLTKGKASGQGNDSVTGIEDINGSSFNDKLVGNDLPNWIRGGTGNDKLVGNEGDDRLEGEGGKDQITAGDGADLLDGGTGNDNLKGEAGDDRLFGRDGDDRMLGGIGMDLLEGGDGDDDMRGDDGTDTLQGGAGEDKLFGDLGDDFLDGQLGNDDLRGGDGNDAITGGAGDDLLIGGLGADVLDRQEGDDKLKGIDADDTIIPGIDALFNERGWINF